VRNSFHVLKRKNTLSHDQFEKATSLNLKLLLTNQRAFSLPTASQWDAEISNFRDFLLRQFDAIGPFVARFRRGNFCANCRKA